MLKKIIFVIKTRLMYENIAKIEERLQEFQIEYEISGDAELKKEALIISDQQEVCCWCVEHQIPVLAYLHKENKLCDFSNVKYAIEDFDGMESCYLHRVYQRYHKIPWNILETRRCIVREMTEADMEGLYELYQSPCITEFLEELLEDREEEREYIRNYIEYVYHFFEYGMWMVEEKGSQHLIGRAGVEWKDNGERLELGYVVAKHYQRQGFAYEICSAIIHYIRENITEGPLYIQTHPANIASQRLAEKLGFHFEKKLNRYILRD